MLRVIIYAITEFYLGIVTGYHLVNREHRRTVKLTVHIPIARRFIGCRLLRDGTLIISNIGTKSGRCISGYIYVQLVQSDLFFSTLLAYMLVG